MLPSTAELWRTAVCLRAASKRSRSQASRRRSGACRRKAQARSRLESCSAGSGAHSMFAWHTSAHAAGFTGQCTQLASVGKGWGLPRSEGACRRKAQARSRLVSCHAGRGAHFHVRLAHVCARSLKHSCFETLLLGPVKARPSP